MQIDQRRKRPVAPGLVDLGQQRLVAVANVFDILHIELVGSGVGGFRIHDGRSLCRGETVLSRNGQPRTTRAPAMRQGMRQRLVVFPV